MKIAVTGWKGRLGSILVKNGCIPLKCDVNRARETFEEIKKTSPDVIIHCASITNVDKCEEVTTFGKAMVLNKLGLMNLIQLFKGRLIYISTDYVFNGKKGPYSEQARPIPINGYGVAKHTGEKLLLGASRKQDLIVRTTILYGSKKPDFVSKIINQLKKGNEFTVPMNLYGTPTYVPHLVEALLKLAEMEDIPNIVNIAGSDWLSRYEFALMIANIFGYNTNLIQPIKYSYRVSKRKAQRPLKAGLKTTLATKLGLPIHTVLSGLQEMKNE